MAHVDDWLRVVILHADDCTLCIRGVLGTPGTFERRRGPMVTVANTQEVIFSGGIQPTRRSPACSVAFFRRLQHTDTRATVLWYE